MKGGIDFDGCLTDWRKMKVYGIEKLFGIKIPLEEFFGKNQAIRDGWITQEQYEQAVELIYSKDKYSYLEPVNGSLIVIKKLISEGHKIIVITGRSGVQRYIAKEWLIQNGLNVRLIGMGFGCSKVPAARGMDFFLDDRLSELQNLDDIVPHRYLLDWPYNQDNNAKGIIRVKSWKDFYNEIHKLQPTV